MPELEYTIEVVSDPDFDLPDAKTMAKIVKDGLRAWNSAHQPGYLDVEVTRVSDDL